MIIKQHEPKFTYHDCVNFVEIGIYLKVASKILPSDIPTDNLKWRKVVSDSAKNHFILRVHILSDWDSGVNADADICNIGQSYWRNENGTPFYDSQCTNVVSHAVVTT